MKLFKTRKSILAAGLATALAASGAGIAFGYFTAADGTSTGAGTVGTSAAWSVSAPLISTSSLAGGIVPVAGTLTVSASVSNPGVSSNQLVSVRTIVERDLINGFVLSSLSGSPISGCLASWFVVTDTTAGLPVIVAGSGVHAASSTITMTNAATDQSSCKNAVFAISMVASSV